MNTVIQILREHIADQNIRFVFPSQTSANLWARKTCTLGIVRSVAAERFLAWDRFKEDVIRERETNREPASSVMRKLFADALIRKNAGEKDPLLKSLVPPEYAQGGAVFIPYIARLLPSLFLWENLMKEARGRPKDQEDEDYETVKNEYAAFLERYGLFEPSWEDAKIRAGSERYIIFFPELIEDFAEYDALLKDARFTRIGAETVSSVSGGQSLLLYQSAREEIRGAVMELERLHEEEGLPYEDMALSIPELEEMEPYLLKEFSLRHIPVTRRAGKKLGESGAGRLFSLMNECASSRFSFTSIKALVLNEHIPWKEREKNKALVNFGIKYNCVSGYVQDGKARDIWEEAFKEGGRELQSYYRELKKGVLELTGSKSFADVRKHYFTFRRGLLDMEKISGEDDAVLSRCIEELGTLVGLEEKFNDPETVPSSPFGFFLSCLDEQEYVRAGQNPGVNIFKWRVAAASPFACHFVLNASQDAASVLYQPMRFLRQDKRKALGLEDRDATGAFFLLSAAEPQSCRTSAQVRDTEDDDGFTSRTRISASIQTFSGWAIPHSYFAQGKTVEVSKDPEKYRGPNDPYREERRFWRAGLPSGEMPADGMSGGGAGLREIFSLQKRSYELWKDTLVQKKNNFSFFNSAVPLNILPGDALPGIGPVRELLENAILGKDGYLTVTPTRDLNVYYKCPLYWLYARIFKAEEFSLEAALLDDTSLGLLYHEILKELFAKIRDEDKAFDSRRLGTYQEWAREITRSAIKEHPAFRGPLAVPLVSPQASGMSKKIAGLLELEAEFFDGYTVAALEFPISLRTGELLIEGVIDRVSVSPDGEPVIIDYKTTYIPEPSDIKSVDIKSIDIKSADTGEVEEISLSEFQMPLYIKLYEEGSGAKARQVSKGEVSRVKGAFFYSINGRRIKTAMGEMTGGRSKAPSREEYESFLEAAGRQIVEFGRRVKALDFIPLQLRIKECLGCVYKTVCRTAYFLNSSAAKETGEGEG